MKLTSEPLPNQLIWLLIVTLCVSFSLIGCGSGESTGDTADSTQTDSGSDESASSDTT
jgi:hypothetical protein